VRWYEGLTGSVPYLKLVLVINNFGSAIIDGHGTFGEAIIFFELSIHEEDRLAVLRGTFLQGLLEQVSGTFEFRTALCQKSQDHPMNI
jgi:hypothetical protein